MTNNDSRATGAAGARFGERTGYRWLYISIGVMELAVISILGFLAFTTFWDTGIDARRQTMAVQARADTADASALFEQFVSMRDGDKAAESLEKAASAMGVVEKLIEGFSSEEEMRRTVSGESAVDNIDGVIESPGRPVSEDSFPATMLLHEVARDIISLKASIESARDALEEGNENNFRNSTEKTRGQFSVV